MTGPIAICSMCAYACNLRPSPGFDGCGGAGSHISLPITESYCPARSGKDKKSLGTAEKAQWFKKNEEGPSAHPRQLIIALTASSGLSGHLYTCIHTHLPQPSPHTIKNESSPLLVSFPTARMPVIFFLFFFQRSQISHHFLLKTLRRVAAQKQTQGN